MKLEKRYEPIPPLVSWSKCLQRTESVLNDFFSVSSSMAELLANHFINAGGKRIRPALVILSGSVGGKITNKVIVLSAIVEAIHVASLLHDDVVDNGGTRRGEISVQANWNNKLAVMLADLILSRSLEFISGKVEDLPYIEEICNATYRMALGQLMEMEHAGDVDLTIKGYLEIIEGKTAALFSSCCKIGGIAGGAKKKVLDKLIKYGNNLGMAFQIQDDYLDYWGEEEELGKPVGNDLREGKVTLPLILAFQRLDEEQSVYIRYKVGNKSLSKKEFGKILSVLESAGIRDALTEVIGYYTMEAVSALSGLPDNRAIKGLRGLAEFLSGRSG